MEKEVYTISKSCPQCGHKSYSKDIVNCLECLEEGLHIELADFDFDKHINNSN
jgi:Zn ribbon nucleic-acid-binding protein